MRRLLLAAALALACTAQGAEIYRWVDEQGVVHFSDDPSRIPPQAKPEKAHPERLIVMGTEAKGGDPGEIAFERRCAACHVLFPEEDRSKEALIDALRDEDGLLLGEQKAFEALRSAARGEGNSDMEPVEVSDEELRAIARWLLHRAM